MLSYRFWRLLTRRRWKTRHPLQSTPLFLKRKTRSNFRGYYWIALFLIGVVALRTIGSGVFAILCFAPFFLALAGTFLGMSYAVNISLSIAEEQEKQRYDLIGVSPVGKEGLHWMACPRAYHRHRSLRSTNSLFRGMYLFLGIASIGMPLIGSAFYIFDSTNSFRSEVIELGDTIASVLPVVIVLAIFYLDIVQSILLGCVVGMLAPTIVHERTTAQAVSLVTFIIAQIVFYISYYLLGGQMFNWFVPDGGTWWNIGVLFMYLAAYYVIREAMINGLLHLLARRLGSSFASLKTAFEDYA